jgi:asparagine synthase (glutamine-hydrolysing)
MAQGAESRLPFMDYRPVEFLFSRGSNIKIGAGKTKWVLREYLRHNGEGAAHTVADSHHAPEKSGAGNHVYRLVSSDLWLRRCIG